MPYSVQLSIEHGYNTVRFSGDLDLMALPLLASLAPWQPPPCAYPGLVVDLTSVTFIDCACTRGLAAVLRGVREGPILVLTPPGVVSTSLHASGFSRHFTVVPVGLPRDGRLHESELRLLMRPWSATALTT